MITYMCERSAESNSTRFPREMRHIKYPHHAYSVANAISHGSSLKAPSLDPDIKCTAMSMVFILMKTTSAVRAVITGEREPQGKPEKNEANIYQYVNLFMESSRGLVVRVFESKPQGS